MIGIVGIIAALTVLALSLVITRLATVALTLTGLSHEAARFQARSAFTGTGFTTGESENVVGHPVRRRIIMVLMIVRSAGIITILISVMLSFAQEGDGPGRVERLVALLVGVAALGLVARSRAVDRVMRRFMQRALRKWTRLDARDYMSLLHLSDDYCVTEVHVDEDDWIAGKELQECELNGEGVTVLGVQREDGGYVGAPTGNTKVHPGDVVLLYGRGKVLEQLDKRGKGPAGDLEHNEAVAEQERYEAEQETRESAREARRTASPQGG
jgi:hypothetical protein